MTSVFTGRGAVGMSGAPAIQEQPLQTVIDKTRLWNTTFQQAARKAQGVTALTAQGEHAGVESGGEASSNSALRAR